MAATTAPMSAATMSPEATMSAETAMARETVAPSAMGLGHFGMATIPVTVIPTMVPAAPAPIERVIGRIGVAGHGSVVANALNASRQQEADADHEGQRCRQSAATHRNLRYLSSSIFHACLAIAGYILS
jgi:hypothetical protein